MDPGGPRHHSSRAQAKSWSQTGDVTALVALHKPVIGRTVEEKARVRPAGFRLALVF
jgi:hypothetical protein